jgi:hypothetical protein
MSVVCGKKANRASFDGDMLCLGIRDSCYRRYGSITMHRFSRIGVRSWKEGGTSVCVWRGGVTVPVCAIVNDGDGGAFIADDGWGILDSVGSVSVPRFDAHGGSCWGGRFIRITDTVHSQLEGMVPAKAGGAFVLYQSVSNEQRLIVQNVDSGGLTSWPGSGAVVSESNNGLPVPLIIGDGCGGVIVMWKEAYRNGARTRVLVQRVNAAGELLWPPDGVDVDAVEGQHWIGSLTCDGAGGAIVNWRDDRRQTVPIMAQHIDSSGRMCWERNGVLVSDRVGSFAMCGSAVTDTHGGIILAWLDAATGSVLCQRIDSRGTLLWSSDGVLVSDRGVSESYRRMQWTGDLGPTIPQAVPDGEGGVIVVYETCEPGRASGVDIYAQRVSPTGVCHWQAGGVPVSTADSTQQNMRATSDGKGGAYVL